MPSRILRNQCPPGVFCLTPGLLGGIVAAVVVIGIVGLLLWKTAPGAAPVVVAAPTAGAAPQPPVEVTVVSEGGDDRYTRAPKPERRWATEPDISLWANGTSAKLPAIATRGIPETYQSMGVIVQPDGAALPLYGRRTASRSDRFQYYTRTDTYNPVQLPIKYKRRDCQDDVGCDELFDGEEVDISPTGQKGKVTIYRFDGPTYVPGLI